MVPANAPIEQNLPTKINHEDAPPPAGTVQHSLAPMWRQRRTGFSSVFPSLMTTS